MLTERLQTLEREARLLEPSAAERARAREAVINYTEVFLGEIEHRKAFDESSVPNSAWSALEIDGKTIGIDAAVKTIEDLVDGPALNPASGGHLGYIPGGGIYYSSLGDYLAAITNRYAGILFASPGAVRMEHSLVDWMASLVGYPRGAAGNLTSGGSIANLSGIVSARDAGGIKARDFHRAVIYTTEHAHHCLDKAYRIAGVGEAVRRNVPMDDRYRMDAAALEKAIEDDHRAGLLPWLIVAAAGTTDVGAIDPLEKIGDIAKRHKLWFHIDAAYGGFFLLTDEGKKKLKGIEKSDSVVMDPHKGLFLPYGLGAILVRERKHLRASHQYQAAYMQDAKAADDSPADLSPELTKHFRGLRLWLPLKLHGIAPFKACLEEKLLLARYVHEQLRQMSGFEVLNEPELSVVAFRYVPREGDANEKNRKIQAMVQADGRVFISSTTIQGRVVLRIAILCFRTHLSTVQIALQVLQDSVRRLEQQSGRQL
ncbi:MAG TPA: aminotransferase class V-fold PLP-dependent enzyme [Phycisphaerae bacterium]|nr:aminotransferase class V-fold PLP-dependent enzyme [Phycisphaerae bacterium]